MCRILLYSSLAYSTTNKITVELSTPRPLNTSLPTNVDGISFCYNGHSSLGSAANIHISSLEEGGNISQQIEQKLINTSSSWNTSSFFQSSARWQINPIESGTVFDILGSDPYYSSSYTRTRYDDMTHDQSGQLLSQGIFKPNVTVAQPSSMQQPISGNLTGSIATSRDTGRLPGNCILITGDWKANTRYQLVMSIQNQDPPANSSTVVPPPALWMLPLTYQLFSSGASAPKELSFTVRGSKQGQLCTIRSSAAGSFPSMFDACFTAVSISLVAAGETNTQVCLAALATVASLPGNVGVFPFNTVPLLNINISAFSESSCPSPRFVLGPRSGGECIDCTNGDIQGTTCICEPGRVTNLVGSKGCGDHISRYGNATDGKTLASELCADFTAYFNSLMQRTIADRLVYQVYFNQAFLPRAAYLMDAAFVHNASPTFWDQYITDERYSASPTRTKGITPNCNRCRDGWFTDIYTGNQVQAYDDHFKAVNTFRFIGYLLDQVGHPCVTLWDPQEPRKWMYGQYEKNICAGSFVTAAP
eukprot:jgi/Chrzof1/13098/Cz07g19210.t1